MLFNLSPQFKHRNYVQHLVHFVFMCISKLNTCCAVWKALQNVWLYVLNEHGAKMVCWSLVRCFVHVLCHSDVRCFEHHTLAHTKTKPMHIPRLPSHRWFIQVSQLVAFSKLARASLRYWGWLAGFGCFVMPLPLPRLYSPADGRKPRHGMLTTQFWSAEHSHVALFYYRPKAQTCSESAGAASTARHPGMGGRWSSSYSSSCIVFMGISVCWF